MNPSTDRFASPKALVPWILLLAACTAPLPQEGPPEVLRLVDLFPQAEVTESPPSGNHSAGTEWRFTEATVWRAGPGARGVRVAQGLLTGRSENDFPLIHLAAPEDFGGSDLLHSVEVRARLSAGQNLEVFFRSEEADFRQVEGRARAFPGDHRTPVVAGEEMKTYIITPGVPVSAAGARHLYLRPTDAADADFEIESVRLKLRREHLGSIPAGIGWHGLGDIYRESLVTRAPESLRYRLTLPSRPRLDLALGTLEDMPVTFVARLTDGGETHTVLEQTLTRPHRWEEAHVDLSAHAGRLVELELTLRSETEGALGFWGNPQVRSLYGGAADRPPSVLLIIADTLRSDHLDLYGYGRPTAPALSRFAKGGVAFTQCIAQGTWTKVSVTSILSGLYPPSHGVTEFHDRLPATATTMAEAFRAAGYATLSTSSIRFTGKFTNLHQGFEVLHESGSLPDAARSKTARHYVDRLIPWLEAHREVPFFALLHVADPHSPYRPYAPYDDLFAEPGRAETFQQEVEKVTPKIESGLLRQFRMPTRSELQSAGVDPQSYIDHELDWYDGSIRAMDAELGRLFERLRHLRLEDDLIVAFLSDHGTEFLDHDRHWHGHSVYGELARVPLVLRGPGIEAEEIRQEVVQTIDLMPTLLELAGIEAPEGIQGRSFTPLLAAGNGERRSYPAFITKAAQSGIGPPPLETESFGMVSEDFKLVAHHTKEGFTYELYDPRADPLDQNDLAAQHPQVVERMAAELAAWRGRAEAERLPETADLEEMSAEELERLRSLGYIN